MTGKSTFIYSMLAIISLSLIYKFLGEMTSFESVVFACFVVVIVNQCDIIDKLNNK